MAEQRALVICAHDDDEGIGCGGTVRKLADEDYQVTTLVFAQGNEGYTELQERDTIVQMRRRERAAAQKVLGTHKCVALGYHDFNNLDCEDAYKTIIETVRATRPSLVLTHYPAEYLAHRTLGQVAPEAVMQAAWKCSLELGRPWSVENIYQFTVLDSPPPPTHIIDVSDTFEAKLEAMQAYESQLRTLGPILQSMKGRAQYFGSLIGVEHGEPFTLSPKAPQRHL